MISDDERKVCMCRDTCLKSKPRALILWLLASCAGLAQGAKAAEPGEDLLALLRAAQLTNRAAFPTGELTAKVDSVWDGATKHTVATVIWQGDKTYWSYEKEELGASESRERGEVIDDGNVCLVFFPEFKLFQEVHDRAATISEQLLLRPDQIWFRIEGIVEWAKLFEPASEANRENPVTVVVSQPTDDRIVVERRRPSGGSLRIEASLAACGNVVAYEGMPDRSSGIWRKGTYEWTIGTDGKCFLKSHDYQRSVKGNRQSPERKFHLEVTSFNPEPVIPPNRFHLSSLNIRPDTTVEIRTRSGIRRVRQGERKLLDENALNDLAELVRSKGFAVKPNEER